MAEVQCDGAATNLWSRCLCVVAVCSQHAEDNINISLCFTLVAHKKMHQLQQAVSVRMATWGNGRC